MKHICVLCSLYPNSINPTSQVFIQQLIWALADFGVKCTVICPTPINQYPELKQLALHNVEVSPKGAKIDVYFPKAFSAGQRDILGIKTARLTTFLFHNAVVKVFNQLPAKPDVIYGHFFTPAGITAARVGSKYNIPSFVAYGESSPWSIYNYGLKKIKKEVKNLAGVIAVSTANKNDLIMLNIVGTDKIRVFPNGIRLDHFYPRDRSESRRRLGFDKDSFIVAFSGHFSDRKGVLRLKEAVEGLRNVEVIYAGKGALEPISDHTIFTGLVNPEDMPFFLSAADVFVLPTLNEGCSNAIIEAVACGLPVISTDAPFNHDVLDETNALLIDSNDITSIRNAIIKVKDDLVSRKALQDGALIRRGELSLEQRAKNIKRFIEIQCSAQ